MASDEMKISKDIVFNKTTGKIVGFMDYDEESFGEELRIAKGLWQHTCLCCGQRNIFQNGCAYIAQFPTTGFTLSSHCVVLISRHI